MAATGQDLMAADNRGRLLAAPWARRVAVRRGATGALVCGCSDVNEPVCGSSVRFAVSGFSCPGTGTEESRGCCQRQYNDGMVKDRELAPATQEALGLLAARVSIARRERHMRASELAERVGVSPATIRKVERGDPSVALGTAFEVATTLGIRLWHDDADRRAFEMEYLSARLSLLPDTVRQVKIDDDF